MKNPKTTKGITGDPRKMWRKRTGTYFVANRKDSALEVIGPLSRGVSITGVTGGQFSAIDAMDHMVDELGPADVRVTAWATGIYDIRRVKEIRLEGRINECRFLVDKAPFEKSPQFAGMLIEHLGVDAFRAAAIHSKIIIVSGRRGNAVMRTSMGFNKNPRTENFDLDVDDEIERFYREWFDSLWDLSAQKLDNREIFARVFDRYQRDLNVNGRPELDGSGDPVQHQQRSMLTRKADQRARKKTARLEDITMSQDEFLRMLGD